MSVFDTSKIRRHNTQLAVAEATKAAEDDAVDLGVPRCCGAFTPSTRVVSRNDGSGSSRATAMLRDAPRRWRTRSSATFLKESAR
jgi:hypothetical protein